MLKRQLFKTKTKNEPIEAVEEKQIPDSTSCEEDYPEPPHYSDSTKEEGIDCADEAFRLFWLDGEITDSSLEMCKIIFRINLEDTQIPVKDRLPIRILINTQGGAADVCWSLVNAIQMSKTPVYTYCYCTAASAGAYLLSAGHKRFAFPGTMVMIQEGSMGFEGNVRDVEAAYNYSKRLNEKSMRFLANHSKITYEDIKKRCDSDWYIDEKEALELGIIDKILQTHDEIFDLGKEQCKKSR